MSIINKIKRQLLYIKKPSIITKKIKYQYLKRNLVHLTFDDNKKCTFFNKNNIPKLGIGYVIKFNGYERYNSIIPAKSVQIEIIERPKPIHHEGELYINYVSKLKEDHNGEYVYLPSCKLISEGKTINMPAKINLREVGIKAEEDSVFLGYGKIDGSFTQFEGIISVNSINSFTPETKEFQETIRMSKVNFGFSCILADLGANGVLSCSWDNVNFEYNPNYNIYNYLFREYKLSIKGLLRKTGTVKLINNNWEEKISWIQMEEPIWSFPDINHEEIQSKINKELKEKTLREIEQKKRMIEIEKQKKLDDEYNKLLKELKNLKTFKSYTTLKKQFKNTGRNISNKELNEMFFHPGYDEKIFKKLEHDADEIYVNNLSFVFHINKNEIKNSKFVWEVPKRTLATYIFKDKLEPDVLLSRLDKTPRMQIRKSKKIQQALGFSGFIVHTTSDSWVKKYNLLLDN